MEPYNKEKCPKCKRKYRGYPALSRRDNKTEICSNCGVAEALSDNIFGGLYNEKM